MSKETVSLIRDSELNCYVCKNIIHALKRVRNLAQKKNEDLYYTNKALQIRQKANQKVIEVTGMNDKQRVFRHSSCDPTLH